MFEGIVLFRRASPRPWIASHHATSDRPNEPETARFQDLDGKAGSVKSTVADARVGVGIR